MDQWSDHIEAVATALLGKPTSRTRKELRYGSKGSFKVNLETGWWDDWEDGDGGKGKGGGVLALIKREKGLGPADAVAWMRDHLKLDIADNRPAARPARHNDADTRPEAPPWDDEPAQEEKPKVKSKMVKTYDYVDKAGTFLFQVCRYEPKTFRQRRKPRPDDKPEDIKGGWVWKRDGITQVPYHLPELIEAIADERVIFIDEGEKNVDNLLDLGVPATCNAGGAGKWPDEIVEYFAGADVVILPNNDPQTRKKNPDGSEGELLWHPDGRPKHPGQDHAKLVASKLAGVAKSVRILPLPNLPVKGDTTDWLEAGGTSEALYKLVESKTMSLAEYEAYVDLKHPPKQFISKFGAVVWGRFDRKKVKYEYLIKGMIPRRETVLIYGASQSGKSFFTHDIAMTVARGGDEDGRYCGRRVKRGIVIYCAPEAGTGMIAKRLPGYAAGKGVSMDEDLPFVCLPARLDLFGDDKQVDDLIAECRHWAAELKRKFPELELEAVVIDTFNKATPGLDEISGKDMSTVMKRFERIGDALGTGLWVVHHKNAAGTAPRGHTSLYAGFETAIEISRPTEKMRAAAMQKQREGEDGGKFNFFLRKVFTGEKDDDGEAISSCVVEWIDKNHISKVQDERDRVQEEKTLPATAGMTLQRRAVFKALKKALEDNGVGTPGSLGLPKSVTQVVHKEKWAESWASMSMDAKPETVRKALARNAMWLVTEGYVGRKDDWCWVTDKGMARKRKPPPPDNVVPFRREQATQESVASYFDGDDYNEPA
jgi:hypothetical protein